MAGSTLSSAAQSSPADKSSVADLPEDKQALAEKIDPELLQMLARMPRRQQRQTLLLLMVVENLLYEMMRERRAREDLE